MKNNIVYDKEYYTDFGGINYHDESAWEPLFKRLAHRIVEDLNPKTVLDTGCAFGYLVAYLRDLGVEAWGIDISEYAISQARRDVKEYLHVMSITDPLPENMPNKYDLVLNIEVLEHLYEDDGIVAMQRITQYSDNILFSSTPDDITEPTHFNVQQVEYWAEKFAKLGFYKNLTYHTDFISKHSGLYQKKEVNNSRLIRDYEQYSRLLRLKYENEQVTSNKLVKDIEILRNQIDNDKDYYNNEIKRLTKECKESICKEQKLADKYIELEKYLNEIKDKNIQLVKDAENLHMANQHLNEHNEELSIASAEKDNKYQCIHKERDEIREYVVALQRENELFNQERNTYYQEKENLKNEKERIIMSRGYRLLLKLYNLENKVIPISSKRRKFVSMILKKPLKLFFKIRRGISKSKINQANIDVSIINNENSFYSMSEIERQNWCKVNPIEIETKFSFVVPLYNTPIELLKELVESVESQIYVNWELCFVNASADVTILSDYLDSICSKDSRIKYKNLKENKGISENTIVAIGMASGEFIVLLDHDDIIAPNALYEYALYLVKHPDIDFFYSDKDMINEEGTQRVNSLYKPELSPEILYSANYLTHLCAIRKNILDKTIGYDKETDGAQDWDIFLKVMEHTDKFKRIPMKLYHWRIISSSVASGISAKPYVLDAQIKALNNYIERKKWNGRVFFEDRKKSILKVNWYFKSNPSVLIIFLSFTGVKKLEFKDTYKCVCLSKNNMLEIDNIIQGSAGDVIILIDADMCVSTSDNFIDELSSWALHPEIGFVSPMLYHESVIQSCGLVYNENEIMDLFYNKPLDYYGELGGAFWYRNLSLFRGECLAVERSKYINYCATNIEFGKLATSYNCLNLQLQGFRNVYDCFAKVELSEKLYDIQAINTDFIKVRDSIKIPNTDIFFNKNITLDVEFKTVEPNILKRELTEIDKYTSDALFLSQFYDFTKEEMDDNSKIIVDNNAVNIKTMLWFLPEFDYAFYAGLYTIFRTADYLRRVHGIKHTFAFLSGLDCDIMLSRIGAAFPELGKCKGYCISNENEIKSLGYYDASVCTLWTTAFYSLKMNKVKKKFYFIQDYEPLFYPGGSTYAQAEATYRFGFKGITNTKGLKEVYEKEYDGIAESLDPSIDINIFYPNRNRVYNNGPYTLFFYGRPGHPRNGFELGINALKILKKTMGDNIRIVTAGANYDIGAYGLNGIVENLGRLKLEETGDLYRQCDAGLVMMFTRHPSYLPYEMMACGCTVVSNYNAYTSWFLKNNDNCVVAEASASSIAGEIHSILIDLERRKKISENAAEQIINANPDWDTSLEKIAEFILK